MISKPISPRTLTASYVFTLLFIAGLAIIAHIVLERSLDSSRESASIINQSGRQRMLSQRIAGLAAQYRSGDMTARDDLLAAIAEMEVSHAYLVSKSRLNPSSEFGSRELAALYYANPNSLDAQVRGFLAAASEVAKLSPADSAMSTALPRVLEAARAPLLKPLEDVVMIQQLRSENRIARLEQFEFLILAILLLTLAVEATLIFVPIMRGLSPARANSNASGAPVL